MITATHLMLHAIHGGGQPQQQHFLSILTTLSAMRYTSHRINTHTHKCCHLLLHDVHGGSSYNIHVSYQFQPLSSQCVTLDIISHRMPLHTHHITYTYIHAHNEIISCSTMYMVEGTSSNNTSHQPQPLISSHLTTCHCTSHHITSHHMPHHITSHHITSHHNISYLLLHDVHSGGHALRRRLGEPGGEGGELWNVGLRGVELCCSVDK
jgi:hypothetical protein